MKPSRVNEEQIISILKEQEAGLGTADLCRQHGISSATFYKWKAKYGGFDVSPRLHPAESRVLWSFGPFGLGGAMGWSAVLPNCSSAPSHCMSGALSFA